MDPVPHTVPDGFSLTRKAKKLTSDVLEQFGKKVDTVTNVSNRFVNTIGFARSMVSITSIVLYSMDLDDTGGWFSAIVEDVTYYLNQIISLVLVAIGTMVFRDTLRQVELRQETVKAVQDLRDIASNNVESAKTQVESAKIHKSSVDELIELFKEKMKQDKETMELFKEKMKRDDTRLDRLLELAEKRKQ